MNWDSFKDKFHVSWHRNMRPFIVSNDCNKIYNYLKANKDKGTIYPKSAYTFRNFKDTNLKEIRVAIIFREPFSDIEPDGIPLSNELTDIVHPLTDRFYHAMEDEFYGLNLHMIKEPNMDFYRKQGVFLHNADLTVFKDKPKSHNMLWQKFTERVIKILVSKNIPIIFIGKDVRERFVKLIPPIYPEFYVQKSLNDHPLDWSGEDKFRQVNKYILENTKNLEVMWVNMDVPF